jgi:hypothetical protein
MPPDVSGVASASLAVIMSASEEAVLTGDGVPRSRLQWIKTQTFYLLWTQYNFSIVKFVGSHPARLQGFRSLYIFNAVAYSNLNVCCYCVNLIKNTFLWLATKTFLYQPK